MNSTAAVTYGDREKHFGFASPGAYWVRFAKQGDQRLSAPSLFTHRGPILGGPLNAERLMLDRRGLDGNSLLARDRRGESASSARPDLRSRLSFEPLSYPFFSCRLR